MAKGKPKRGSTLGKQLIKSKQYKKYTLNKETLGMYTTDIDAKDERRRQFSSNTDSGNQLENFLEMSEMEQKVFEAEKQNVVVLMKTSSTVMTQEERTAKTVEHQQIMEKNKLFWNSLTIPRRPYWDENTTTEELLANEKESFYNWRRELAKLEESEGLIVTPYEKNPEVWKQLWRVSERSDVLIQIVDARNPLLFRSPDLEKYAKEIDERKGLLLLVNKADLLTKAQRRRWAKYFDSEKVNFRFFSAHKEQVRIDREKQIARLAAEGATLEEAGKIPQLIQDEEEEEIIVNQHQDEEEEEESTTTTTSTSSTKKQKKQLTPEEEEMEKKIKILNTSELLQEVLKMSPKSLDENNRYDGRVIVGMSGYPNVGKSSTINVLYGEKKVAVAPTPGKTKYVQTIILDEKIVLLDCPGLVFPTLLASKADMVCNGLLPIDQLRDYVSPVELICERISRKYLEEFYAVGIPKPKEHEPQDRPPTAAELLSAYAQMRGFRTVHGVPDQSRSARIVLKDLVNGKLLYCHPPPGLDSVKFQRKNPKIRGAKTIIKDGSLTEQEEKELRAAGATKETKERKVTYDVSVEHDSMYDEQQAVIAKTKSAATGGLRYTRTAFKHTEVSLSSKLDKLKLKEKELKDLAIKQAKERIAQQQQQQQNQ